MDIKSKTPLHFILWVIIFISTTMIPSCKVKDYKSTSRPISHELWDDLLQKYVSEDGKVNYQGFINDSLQLNQYLELLRNNHPNEKNWKRDQRLAYWINAYNAFTLKLVTDHYPVNSIKDIKKGIPFINSVFDLKFIRIEAATYDLNNIEHGIIRAKFNDARIHFALNCASGSCPNLHKRAYTATQLDRQLDQAARNFLSDNSKNMLKPESVQLSKIFSWYRGDFKKEGSLIDFINRYAPVQMNKDAKIDYLKYDWGLNE